MVEYSRGQKFFNIANFSFQQRNKCDMKKMYIMLCNINDLPYLFLISTLYIPTLQRKESVCVLLTVAVPQETGLSLPDDKLKV